MSRRGRPNREHFSFDSFLDLVTNVVGIIIRLILVVWVGARSYTGLVPATPSGESGADPPPALPADPLQDEVGRQQAQLDRLQAQLLDQLRQLDLTREEGRKTELDLMAMTTKRQALQQARTDLDRAADEKGTVIRKVSYTLAELQKRREKLTKEIEALNKLPPLKKTLRYRTPVSQPVHAEEWHFECRNGRATFVDVHSMLEDVRHGMEDKVRQLRNQWEVTDVTGVIGAFRMRYTLERDRGLLESFGGIGPDAQNGRFRYGLSRWIIEPVASLRGETADAALRPSSEFRRVVDGLSPDTSVVTFWVYPDSFGVYRQLRDYLADRDITVAGRPLPADYAITCSRNGSLSRGQ